MYITSNPKLSPELASNLSTAEIIAEIDALSAVLDSPFADEYADISDMIAWHNMLCEECYYRLKRQQGA